MSYKVVTNIDMTEAALVHWIAANVNYCLIVGLDFEDYFAVGNLLQHVP